MQNDIQRKLKVEHQSSPQTIHTFSDFIAGKSAQETSPKPSKVVKYEDLPYMGEMTLDNSKPRRGRKPKKADICHLIYKNYGTVLPGTPVTKEVPGKVHEQLVCKTKVQNKIISSLLERRLMLESSSSSNKDALGSRILEQCPSEPLNLCIRDLDHINIRLEMEMTEEIKVKLPKSDDEVKDFELPGLEAKFAGKTYTSNKLNPTKGDF